MSSNIFNMEKKYLKPAYDYDFTNMKDDGSVYKRGGMEYIRPYGWKRIAMNVKDKYEGST